MSLQPPSYHAIQSLRMLGINFRLLGVDEAEGIRSQVIGRFASHRGGVIWQNLLDSASVQDQDGWRRIDEYLLGSKFLLFFDETEDRNIIEFPIGSSLTSVLEECPYFEFYVTNDEVTYLLCFNHHEFLISAGQATYWDIFKTAE